MKSNLKVILVRFTWIAALAIVYYQTAQVSRILASTTENLKIVY